MPVRVGTTLAFALALVAGCVPDGAGDAVGDPEVTAFPARSTWQITLLEPPTLADVDLDVAVWDLDLFDVDVEVVEALQARGTKVVCYFSAGTWEPFREDADDFPARIIGNGYEDDAFAEERYLDVTDPLTLELAEARLDRAVAKGCDGVDPDNVDLHLPDTGFAISEADMLAFNVALADAAHRRGLAVGLKNSIELFDDLAGHYDFAVNEECFQFDECDAYAAPFIADDKAVFHIEYVEPAALDAICAVTVPLGLSTLQKNLVLDAPFTACP